jgi:hypothetical protein
MAEMKINVNYLFVSHKIESLPIKMRSAFEAEKYETHVRCPVLNITLSDIKLIINTLYNSYA